MARNRRATAALCAAALLLLLAGCGGGGGSDTAKQDGATMNMTGSTPSGDLPALKSVTITASATQPQAGAAAQVLTFISHNLHSDPHLLNAGAAATALGELNQDFPLVANHQNLPNTAAGVWDFTVWDGEYNILTAPGLKGTLATNPLLCPPYMAQNQIRGARPADNALWGQYCQRLVQYYNTAAGFVDGGNTFRRAPVRRIGYWELWGEPNINEFADDNMLPFDFGSMTPAQLDNFLSTPNRYRDMYEAAAGLMKAADPTIRVGGPGVTDVTTDAAAMDYITVLLGTASPLDFVSYHDYAAWDRTTADQDAFLQISSSILAFAQKVQGAIAASTHPGAELWISEGNGNALAYAAPVDARANNIFDVAYMASLVRGYVLLGVKACERFELMEAAPGIFSLVDSAGVRSPAFWGWKVLTTFVVRNAPLRQTTVVDPGPAKGQPTVEAFALQPAAGLLHVLVVNKTVQNAADNSSQNATVQGGVVTVLLTIANGIPSSATLNRVDGKAQNAIDVEPLAITNNTVTFQMRGYGVACVVVTLQ